MWRTDIFIDIVDNANMNFRFNVSIISIINNNSWRSKHALIVRTVIVNVVTLIRHWCHRTHKPWNMGLIHIYIYMCVISNNNIIRNVWVFDFSNPPYDDAFFLSDFIVSTFFSVNSSLYTEVIDRNGIHAKGTENDRTYST